MTFWEPVIVEDVEPLTLGGNFYPSAAAEGT
jgi:hypothetical protein